MNREILYIAVLLFCCLFNSCLDVVDYMDLGNNYAWLYNKTIVKYIEKNDSTLVWQDYVIRPEVINFDDDNRYIVAYQVYSSLTRYYYSDTSEEEDSILVDVYFKDDGELVKVPQPDSLVAQYEKIKEMQKCYWIIDKETDKVMGPMTKEEFDRQCKALNVKAKMSDSPAVVSLSSIR